MKKLLNLSAKIAEALNGEANNTKPSPVATREVSRNNQTITWGRGSFGSVSLELQTFTLGPLKEECRLFWSSQIDLGGRQPGWVDFVVKHTQPNGGQKPVKVLFARNNEPIDVTESRIPLFRIQLGWNGDVPRIMNEMQADFDIVLLQEDGSFLQIEFAYVTRFGRHLISVQEVYAGQVVRTTKVKAEKLELKSVGLNGSGHVALVVPLYPENAYPGADYFNSFHFMAPAVTNYAVQHASSVTLSECVVAEWNPQYPNLPVAMAEKGWEIAVPKFFNNAAGFGRLHYDGDVEEAGAEAKGVEIFAHFKQILDDKGVPVAKAGIGYLRPMRGVAVRWQKDDQGRSKATAIRVLPM